MGNPDAFCQFMRNLADEELVQKIQPQNIESVDKNFLTREGNESKSDLIYKIFLYSKIIFIF